MRWGPRSVRICLGGDWIGDRSGSTTPFQHPFSRRFLLHVSGDNAAYALSDETIGGKKNSSLAGLYEGLRELSLRAVHRLRW